MPDPKEELKGLAGWTITPVPDPKEGPGGLAGLTNTMFTLPPCPVLGAFVPVFTGSAVGEIVCLFAGETSMEDGVMAASMCNAAADVPGVTYAGLL